jgi:hypothetical protein
MLDTSHTTQYFSILMHRTKSLFFIISKKKRQDNESSIRGNQDYDAEGSGSLVASVQNRLINKL